MVFIHRATLETSNLGIFETVELMRQNLHYLVNDKTRTIKIISVFHQSKNIEMVNEKIQIRKIHDLRNQKDQKLQQRMNQLEKIRQRKKLDKGLERD